MTAPRPARQYWRLPAALAFVAALGWICRAAVLALDPAFAIAPVPNPTLAADALALAWSNAVVLVLAMLVLWAACGRALLSLWIGGWLLWSLYAIDALKFAVLRRHLSPGDLHLLPQVVENSGLFMGYVAADPSGYLFAAGVVAVAIALARWEPRSLPRWRRRWPLLLLALLPMASLLRGDGFWRQQFSDAALAGFEVWAPDRSVSRAGLPASLVKLGWESGVQTPPADAERLAAFAQAQAEALQRRRLQPLPAPLPDLVLVQSEALFDAARLRGVEAADTLANFRRLAARGVHGDLRVPAFGGATIRTEFEVLTGIPLSAFPQISYPYYGLAMRPMPTLPRRLAALGYSTQVLHPYRRSFWNRDTALRRLGIEQATFEDDAALRGGERHGPFISDRALYRATLAALREDAPQFALVVTMENHSPWQHRNGIDEAARDALPVPHGLAPAIGRELQNYLLHVASGDAALGEFADALLARERPTVLLVYGDHMPGMERVFDALGFDDDIPAWMQPVPYFIVSNQPLPVQRIDTDAYLLPGLLLALLDFPVDGYLGWNAQAAMLAASADAPERAALRETLQHAAWHMLGNGGEAASAPATISAGMGLPDGERR